MPPDVAVVKEPTREENDANFAAAFAQLADLDEKTEGAETAPGKTDDPAVKPGGEAAEDAATAAALAAAAGEKTTPAAAATSESGGLPEPAEAAASAVASAAASAAAVAAAKPAEQASPADGVQPPVTDEDFLKRLGSLLHRAEPAPEKTAAPVVERPEPVQLYSPDELAQLEAYDKDYPDIARMEAIRRRGEYYALAQSLTDHIFSEVISALTPITNQLRTLTERTHLGDLQTAVPDYGQQRDAVIAWVAKQPSYLKIAYDHVVQQGSVEEIKDLINRWRAEAGVAVPAVNGVAASETKVELSPAAKKAAAALAPIASKRSGAVVTQPTDFDEAFDQFDKEVA